MPVEDYDIEREEYTVNRDETCNLFLHIIERAILDYKGLAASKIPIEQEWFQTAKAFLFDPSYKISWGIYDIGIRDILAYMDLDDEWFFRKLEEKLDV